MQIIQQPRVVRGEACASAVLRVRPKRADRADGGVLVGMLIDFGEPVQKQCRDATKIVGQQSEAAVRYREVTNAPRAKRAFHRIHLPKQAHGFICLDKCLPHHQRYAFFVVGVAQNLVLLRLLLG
jgi:hypothetical protein